MCTLDKTFQVHITESCLPGDNRSDLSKLSSEEKTVGVAEDAFGGTNINVGEEQQESCCTDPYPYQAPENLGW